jgi:hypothetical protein
MSQVKWRFIINNIILMELLEKMNIGLKDKEGNE